MRLDDELLQLPVVLDKDNRWTDQIIAIVDKLRNYRPQRLDWLHPNGVPEAEIQARRCKWEDELDEAVFELYGLNEEQKDLVRDCCEVTLPFLYDPFNSIGASPAVENNNLSWIETYARIFSRRWNAYLENGIEMRGTLHIGAHDNLVALEFFPAEKSDPWDMNPKNNSWQNVLDRIGSALPHPMGTSQIIMDGVVHAVSDYAVIVVKRNERRFWTRSLAREDADSTLCKRMLMSNMRRRRIGLMGRHSVPSFSVLWKRHETLCVGVFIMALRRLSENGCDSTNEDDISEQLCLLLREICFEEFRENDREIPIPDWDGPISPATKNELKGGKKKKRPDFTCNLLNTLADSSDDFEISFHVECKLLGAPTSRTWILNENYVTHGIKRFDSRSHEYGKRASSGMMIGYIRSMSPETILEEVNSHQRKHCSENPAIQFDSLWERIQQYGQKLKRKHVRPQTFKLIHLWVDLRK